MTEYGVIPTGFNRKPLAVILAEIEAKNITEFGPDVIQTSQSPLGQVNGLLADLISEVWEIAESVYQSYDINQAEGSRLDSLARLRLMRRGEGEAEAQFRSAITNQDQARIDLQDVVRALKGLNGVTYVQVFLNDTQDQDQDDRLAFPAGYICAAVLGGDNGEIAEVLRQYVVPGISTFGNTYVTTSIEGFCRTLAILRPVLVPMILRVKVIRRNDNAGCPAPSLDVIKVAALNAAQRAFINGNDVTNFRIRSLIEGQFPNVEVVLAEVKRDDLPFMGSIGLGFTELPTFALDDFELSEV